MANARTLDDLIDLSGQRALVTGGGRGIGAAISRRLQEAGARVTIADLDPAAADAAAKIGAGFVRCDISNAQDLSAAFDAASQGDPLEILVNNAGIFPTTGQIIDVEDDFVARMLDINVRAQFSATREAARRMTGGGKIINIASIVGIRGGNNISAYGASKAAVIALTRAASSELGPKGIRVNAIAPGVIDTPGVQAEMEPLKKGGLDVEAVIAANPLGLAGAPDHIARAALFLASDLAAFVTGHVMVVDGGATA